MNSYNHSRQFHVPSLSTALGLSSAWLTFIAVAGAFSLGSAGSTGELVTRLVLTAGAAAAAAGFFRLMLQMRRDEEEFEARLTDSLDAQQSPRSAEGEGKAA